MRQPVCRIHESQTVFLKLFRTVLRLGLPALLALGAELAQAANLVVNTLADASPSATDGNCSLREAIDNANADNQASADCPAGTGADTITFSVAGTIVLGSILPQITDADALTIDGAGQSVTISGNNAVGVFELTFRAVLALQNLTVANGLADTGGGIANNGGTVTIINSTLAGNRARIGGGINSGGTVTITNSTLAGNSAGDGGGINTFGTATITNSTLTGNSASNAGGGINNGGTVTLTNSIVANSPAGGNCFNFRVIITDGGNNIDDGATCGFGANSKSSTNPLLDPAGLKDNGGPTQTIALCIGVDAPTAGCTAISPAIDMANNSICAAAPVNNKDQRGFDRPKDGDNNGVAVCDIGAFELQPPPALTCNGKTVTIKGTPGNDNLAGTNGDDVIHGLGGNDNIAAGNGNDTVCGGEGNDNISGGNGIDKLFGEGGRDNLSGGNGADTLDGGADSDICSGGAGSDTATNCETTGGIP